jgi:transposase
MKDISSADKANVISPLLSGHSIKKLESIAGLGKSTVGRNALKRSHLKAVVKAKKPLLKARHRQRRLEFALYHQNWTIEDWKQVI